MASSALPIKSAKGSLFTGVCGHSLTCLASVVWLEGCSLSGRGSSCSITPFSHDAWFSLVIWFDFNGDLAGDFAGDFSGLCSALSSYRKLFNFVRDFEEIEYVLRGLDMIV